MADTAVEFYTAIFHGREDLVFAHERGASGFGRFALSAVGGADDCYF